MEALLEDFVSGDDLKKFERNYYDEESSKTLTNRTRFEYSWALIRSKFRADIKRGILLLEDLCSTGDEEARRDYLFYLAIANTKLGENQRALECCKKFLSVEPNNRQAQELEKIIKDRQLKEGLKGAAVVGGAALVVGGIVGLAMALAKK